MTFASPTLAALTTKPGKAYPYARLRNLSALHYANGFTHWHLRAQSIIDILDSRYFKEEVFDLIAEGDQVSVSANDGSALAAFGPGKAIFILSKVLWQSPGTTAASGVDVDEANYKDFGK